MSLAISVENVSKLYHLGSINRGLLWKDARRWFRHRLFGQGNKAALEAQDANEDKTLFWALKDITFDIKEGGTVGIIGRNGAGKSTLLKILSRITAPSTGVVKIKGRVGSLLEVGTGFHPELTGRDNLYLYGGILGMGRDEIRGKFDDIVSFAELEKFIDTPVKRYSSGMYVRLAFSVAAFLEPEILIVDEALSVGDQQFQNRCIQRIEEIINDGRTLLFVSHGAGQVRKICRRAICLKAGKIVFDGDSNTAIDQYVDSLRAGVEPPVELALPPESAAKKESPEVIFDPNNRPGDDVKLVSCRLVDQGGDAITAISSGEPFYLEVTYEVIKDGLYLRVGCLVNDELGNVLFWTVDTSEQLRRFARKVGTYCSRMLLPADFLAPGKVTFGIGVGEHGGQGKTHVFLSDVISVLVTDDHTPGSVRCGYAGPLPGFIRPRMLWTTKEVE